LIRPFLSKAGLSKAGRRGVRCGLVWVLLAAATAAPFAHASDGSKMYAQLQKDGMLLDDKEWQAYVQQIGDRLLVADGHKAGEIHYYVIDTADVNAVTLAGGYVFIYRGLISLMNSEDQLASVIGHETGHALSNHVAKSKGTQTLTSIGGWLAYMLTGVAELKDTADAAGAMVGADYSQQHELEADRIGSELIAKAGYNPEASIEAMQLLKDEELYAKASSGGRMTYHGLFASHPDTDKRLHEMALEAAKYEPDKAQEPIRNFWNMLDGMAYGDEARHGVVRDETFYNSSERIVVTYPQDWQVVGGARVIEGRAPGGSGHGDITVQRQEQVQGQDPKTYVEKTLKRDDVKSGESLEVNGLKAYLGHVDPKNPGDSAMIAVVFKDSGVYYFKGEADAHTDPTAFEKDFRATVGSFRAMVKADLSEANRLRIKVIQATPEDTYKSLAARSQVKSDAELRLINGDYPNGEPRAGNPIKIVQ